MQVRPDPCGIVAPSACEQSVNCGDIPGGGNPDAAAYEGRGSVGGPQHPTRANRAFDGSDATERIAALHCDRVVASGEPDGAVVHCEADRTSALNSMVAQGGDGLVGGVDRAMHTPILPERG